ncbi:hypothetical protein BGZ83_011445 [Gryganskiella cystojenkinii]|nr:hypothetical protein BGZ83_011445 [Gryganskiella cystojenkinii]
MSDLYHKLKQLKQKLVDPSVSEPKKLFMVKVDIKKSFDSINQAKLLDVMNSILKEDKYHIHRHSKLMPSNGRIMKRFIKRALPVGEMPPFVDHAQLQAMGSKHALFVDKVVHGYQTKGATLDLLRGHVQQNIVKFGKDFYRQTTGIPQGSILSPALCRFFYDEMERNVLTELAQSNDNALVRLADDFLFISRREVNARTFLEQMSAGHHEYGCYINETKTIVNFDMTLNGVPVQKCSGNEFPYCGLLLHTKTMEISADFGRYRGEDIRDLLTVGRDKHPGRSITLRMKKGMQHMCQMAFSDTTYNSLPTVMRNIYQNFIFCAMKFHAYCQELLQDPTSRHHVRASALPSVVLGILRACFGLLHNGRRSTVGVQAGVKFQVSERHVHWLGAMAFCSILPKLEVYEPMRSVLQEQVLGPLAREERTHFKRMLYSVVKDPRNKIMDGIRY